MRTWHLPHLLLLLWATFAQADPGKLEYLSEISPPFNFSDQQGMPTGLSVELMQLIWKARGVSPQPIRILPWARGYNLLQQKPNVVLFATARTPQREALFKWACPIDHSEFVLLGRKADNITLGSEAEISRYKVGVVRSTVSKQLLLERGIDERQLMLANRLTQAAKMLTSGRADLFATNKLAGYQTLQQLYSSAKVRGNSSSTRLFSNTGSRRARVRAMAALLELTKRCMRIIKKPMAFCCLACAWL